MAGDTATLVLNGRVSLVDFATAMDGFLHLMRALTDEVASGADIDWEVQDLVPGSSHTTIQGIPASKVEPMVVERVTDAYTRVGQAMQENRPVPYSIAVRAAADKLLGILDGRVRSLTFETEAQDVEISVAYDADSLVMERRQPIPPARTPFGAVRGRVQTVSSRTQLRFTLYDLIHDSAVACYLRPGFEDQMRLAWGRLAIVEGLVRRDPYTGKPQSIRQVQTVRVMPEPRGTWRDVFGAAPPARDGMSTEDAVRKVRDG